MENKQVTEVSVKIHEANFEWILQQVQRDQLKKTNYFISKEFQFDDIDVTW